MIYQLPNGKVLWLTLEEYLSLTDEEINQLANLGYGDTANSPWTGSVLPQNARNPPISSDDDAMDYSLVYDDTGSDIIINVSFEDIDIDNMDIPDDEMEE